MDAPNTFLATLLCEELKSRKLSALLHELGVEEQCPYLPALSDLTATCLGLTSDAAFEEYDLLMDAYVKRSKSVADLKSLASVIASSFHVDVYLSGKLE